MPGKEEEEKTKASVYVDPEEYRQFHKGAVERGTKVTAYLLGLIRFGKVFLGEYDLEDAVAIFRGKETNRDWIKAEVKAAGKDVSLDEYRPRLLKRLEASHKASRFCEIQNDVIKEELDEVESLPKKAES